MDSTSSSLLDFRLPVLDHLPIQQCTRVSAPQIPAIISSRRYRTGSWGTVSLPGRHWLLRSATSFPSSAENVWTCPEDAAFRCFGSLLIDNDAKIPLFTCARQTSFIPKH
ncbi:hypothetical protein MGG_11544 [Pyricularia oryzae 70-15]|uniref:Uncharacterized protein n=3 Tax=Pyricularia oryzae TaxID=318829 RepID=G4NB74_PYRO7|nr:uncharacterized protein MGG_11544 [Pyricularia oryzae 70-15]EHA48836.1 hypothetical protein MGG_11544 [Pyricularia oryzae 70-15]ELQ38736.1 hypothetical protein OOU_Y34scaffold00528g28 [Pyricularia oryzae Y34]